MQSQDFDLAILGGGPVGSALALLLARLAPQPARIVLLQAETASQYGHRPELDPRVLAVNHGSRVLDAVQPRRSPHDSDRLIHRCVRLDTFARSGRHRAR